MGKKGSPVPLRFGLHFSVRKMVRGCWPFSLSLSCRTRKSCIRGSPFLHSIRPRNRIVFIACSLLSEPPQYLVREAFRGGILVSIYESAFVRKFFSSVRTELMQRKGAVLAWRCYKFIVSGLLLGKYKKRAFFQVIISLPFLCVLFGDRGEKVNIKGTIWEREAVIEDLGCESSHPISFSSTLCGVLFLDSSESRS